DRDALLVEGFRPAFGDHLRLLALHGGLPVRDRAAGGKRLGALGLRRGGLGTIRGARASLRWRARRRRCAVPRGGGTLAGATPVTLGAATFALVDRQAQRVVFEDEDEAVVGAQPVQLEEVREPGERARRHEL